MFYACSCTPPNAVEPRNIHQLPRRPIRLRRIKCEIAFKAHHLAHQFGQFLYGHVLAHTHIHQRRLEAAGFRLVAAKQARVLVVVQVHQEDAGIGHVVAVEEFAARGTSAPDGHGAVAALLGFVKLAQQCRDDVAVFRVVVVARPVQIGRHHRQVLRAVLAVVAPAHFDAGDLGERVGAVGGLQRAGEQAVFAHRLRRQLGVDAAGAEEHEPRNAVLPRAVDHVGLDREVVADEFGRVAVIGDDATHLGRGQEQVFRPVLGEEAIDRCGVGQIEFGVGALQDVRVALALKIADDGRADQTAVAGDVDAGVLVHVRLAPLTRGNRRPGSRPSSRAHRAWRWCSRIRPFPSPAPAA